MGRPIVCVLLILLSLSSKTYAQQVLRPAPDAFVHKRSLIVLPQNFYNQHLGFFCKKESQLQLQVRLPVFIRLGSKAYVDYLEQKPNSRRW
jgi:hypothetical protein